MPILGPGSKSLGNQRGPSIRLFVPLAGILPRKGASIAIATKSTNWHRWAHDREPRKMPLAQPVVSSPQPW